MLDLTATETTVDQGKINKLKRRESREMSVVTMTGWFAATAADDTMDGFLLGLACTQRLQRTSEERENHRRTNL